MFVLVLHLGGENHGKIAVKRAIWQPALTRPGYFCTVVHGLQLDSVLHFWKLTELQTICNRMVFDTISDPEFSRISGISPGLDRPLPRFRIAVLNLQVWHTFGVPARPLLPIGQLVDHRKDDSWIGSNLTRRRKLVVSGKKRTDSCYDRSKNQHNSGKSNQYLNHGFCVKEIAMIDPELAYEFNRQACFLLTQSVRKLEHCLGQIDFEQCWSRPAEGLNSIGNLLLHINGNLRQWAIAGLTDAVDERDRRSEFEAGRSETVAELLQLTRATVKEAQDVINAIESGSLIQTIEIQGFRVTTMQAILHTTAHFQGHTHQIILLTRMQLGNLYQFEWTADMKRGDLPM